MTDYEIVEYHHYFPPGVRRILASGSSAFIGLVDDSTVLKYTLEPGGDRTRLEIEHQILTTVGKHPNIIAQKGLTDQGLYLERAVNGTIYWYLADSGYPAPTVQQRLTWCLELVQAVEHVHSKSVIHCDIQPTNVLLDENLHIKLADFQGISVSKNGTVILTGWSGEPCRYFCPRDDEFSASVTTDLFALGSTLYFIMTGHEVFPDIVGGQEGWDQIVRTRFESGIFPVDESICTAVTRKCWRCTYTSASEVLVDLKTVEQRLVEGS